MLWGDRVGGKFLWCCLWVNKRLSPVKGELISCPYTEMGSFVWVCCVLIAFSSKQFLYQGSIRWSDKFWFPFMPISSKSHSKQCISFCIWKGPGS